MSRPVVAAVLPHLDETFLGLLVKASSDEKLGVHAHLMKTESDTDFVLLLNRAFARSFALDANSVLRATTPPGDLLKMRATSAGSVQDDALLDDSPPVPMHVFSAVVPGEQFGDKVGADRLVPGHIRFDGEADRPGMAVMDVTTQALLASREIGWQFLYYETAEDGVGPGIVGVAIHPIAHDADAKTHAIDGSGGKAEEILHRMRKLGAKCAEQLAQHFAEPDESDEPDEQRAKCAEQVD